MQVATKSGKIHELIEPSNSELMDAFHQIRTGDTLYIVCKSEAQWHDTGIIVKDEFPNTRFRITKVMEGDNMTLTIKVL